MDPARRPDHSDPLFAALQSRGLRLLEQIGQTGEARFYRVQTPAMAPPALVAVLNPSSDPAPPFPAALQPLPLLEQLRQASRIKHPNVARVYEVGEASGLVYAVLEEVSGELLADVIAGRGPLPLQAAVDLFLQVAAGLHAAHGVGVVHGNLSPATTLVLSEDHDGRPLLKVTGFRSIHLGAQTAEGPRDAAPGNGFVSPERLAGNAPDVQDDVFSLGAVLHYMIIGAPPTARSVRRSIPFRVRAVLSEALGPPANRFHSVAEFADALQAAMLAHRRAKESSTRRTLILGAVGVSLVLLVRLWREWDPRWLTDLAREYREAVSGVMVEHPVPADSVRAVAGGRAGRQLDRRRVRTSDTSAAGYAPFTEDTAPSAPGTFVSPFRRSHPWAAVPGGSVYFRSGCSLALSAPELVYFRSEEKARATGRKKSAVPGCF